MASFSSYQDSSNMNSFLVDSVFMNKIMSGFMEDEINMAMNTNCFSQIYPQTEPDLQEITTSYPVVPEIISSCLDHNSEMGFISHEDNEPSVTRKQSSESSTVVDKLESGDQQVTQKLSPIVKKRRTRNGSGSSQNSAQSKEYGREEKGKKKQKQCNGEANKEKKQQKAKADKKDQKKAAAATTKQQEPPSGYIHVRARRGQATDSHSLAERVRREKISERMQILQRLVPGCDKVTGKALVLDEIINYVQSLQNQVEFLSMKLASVDPMLYDLSLEQDSSMHFITPQERLNSMHASPLQQCSPNQLTGFADTPTPPTNIRPNTFNNPLDISAFSQDNASLLWVVEEQGDKFLNPSGFSDNY